MTLYAASKGFEFDYVYIMGLEEELLPHKNSIIAESIEEERRLMYVGITRARKELTMTLAAQRRARGQMKTTTLAGFIDELPTEHIDAPGMKNQRQPTNQRNRRGLFGQYSGVTQKQKP